MHVRPSVALADEVARSNGMVQLIADELNRVVDEGGSPVLIDHGGMNPTPDPLVLLFLREREHLVSAARHAIAGGVEVEMESLQVAYADQVLDVVEDVARELGHNVDDPAVVEAIGRVLTRLAAGQVRPAIGGAA
ncbi:hypothetical protein MXD59_12710 [Frankia sp. Ag45/Mut15]|uniref:Uncharacterized protein n=1 Tax=Frankia umida TaxID=573489 RepID=A0ABT0JYL8_9ACTN|nr:hypothetical protein [Frankia umida]MCK9876629.1 hypothetical protein [Frankia umida]